MLATWVMFGALNFSALPPGKAHPLAARREQVELLLKADPLYGTSRAIYEQSAAVVRRLADAEAEAGDRAAGVKWAERWREALLTAMAREAKVDLGPTSIYEIKVALIEAELDLNRRREAVKGQTLLRPADKLRLYTDRVEALVKIEKLAAKNFQNGNTTEAEYLVQKIALLEAESELAQLKSKK